MTICRCHATDVDVLCERNANATNLHLIGKGGELRTNYVLIDYENVHVKSLDLLQGDHYRVVVFLGPKNTRLPVELVVAMQRFGERADYILLETSGANALDFHLAYYLGKLVSVDPSSFFHIISKDTGFDPLIQHLKGQKIFSVRSPSIDEMPCFRAAPVERVEAGADNGSSKNGSPAVVPTVDELIRIAVDDLVRRKASKPRKTSTLRTTIHARCGKNLPAATIDAVYAGLVKQGFVKVNGGSVSYALPAV